MNHCTSKCSIETQREYRENHINWWNHKKLERKLKNAGFDIVSIVAPRQSSSPVMRNTGYFDTRANVVLLYMEAIKN
jgi:hypothetical protein